MSPLYYTKLTKIEGFVCPPNISETVVVRTVVLAHRPHYCLDNDQTHFKTNFTVKKIPHQTCYHLGLGAYKTNKHFSDGETTVMVRSCAAERRGQHCKVCSKYSNRRIPPQRKTQAEVDRPIERRHEEKQYTPRAQKSSLYYICIIYWRH